MRLFLNHSTTTHGESLDAVTMVFYFISITQELLQTKLNALQQINGKIPMLFSAGLVSVVEFLKVKHESHIVDQDRLVLSQNAGIAKFLSNWN